MTPAEMKEFLATQQAQFNKRRPTYQALAVAWKQVLQAILKTTGCNQNGAFTDVSVRAKDTESFLEKILRKQREKGKDYRSPVDQFTDLCGARVVVQTQAEVRAVRDRLESLIREGKLAVDRKNSWGPDVTEDTSGIFGYRSIHYILAFLAPKIEGVKIDSKLRVNRPEEEARYVARGECLQQVYVAEIQVRSLTEHLWANEGHDRFYKSAAAIPAALKHRFARVAALLEEVDESVLAVRRELEFYESQSLAHRDEKAIRKEIDQYRLLQAVQHTLSEKQVLHLARLHAMLGDWSTVASVLQPFTAPEDYRISLLQAKAVFEQTTDAGAAPLAQAEAHLSPLQDSPAAQRDWEYHALLAAIGRRNQEQAPAAKEMADAADQAARDAYLAAPDHPRPVRLYLERQLVKKERPPQDVAGPAADRALKEAQRLQRDNLYVPESYFDEAILRLVRTLDLKGPEADNAVALAVEAACRGKATSHFDLHFKEFASSLRNLISVGEARHESVQLLQQFVQLIHRWECHRQHTGESKAPRAVILAGTSAGEGHRQIATRYGPLLERAFDGYDGIVICPGTKLGVGALYEKLRTVCSPAARFLAAIPEGKKKQAITGIELLLTEADDFSLAEVIAYWTQLIEEGISDVRLVGIGGGTIARLEYLLANALGVHAGLIRGSGREADALACDPFWSSQRHIHSMPPDPETLRLFVQPPPPIPLGFPAARLIKKGFPDGQAKPRVPLFAEELDTKDASTDKAEDVLAYLIHIIYQESKLRKTAGQMDESLKAWKDLAPDFRESNRSQARNYPHMLEMLGLEIAPGTAPGKPETFPLHEELQALKTELRTINPAAPAPRPSQAKREQIARTYLEKLEKQRPHLYAAARREHARWNIERLVEQGWRYNPVTNKAKKEHADIVGWDELYDEVKLYDVEAVLHIPTNLARLGVALRPKKAARPRRRRPAKGK